mgnify:CR=1 FL=1
MIKQKKSSQKGFTLIELMVVIVIIGILVAIALPNFIGAQDRAKLSSVKSNMHTIQTMLETYRVDWGGVYPGNVVQLSTEATGAGKTYWKDFANPFSGTSGTGVSYTDEGGTKTSGVTTYDPSGTSNVTRYYVYGYDKIGGKIQVKGVNFYLTNS